MRLSGAFLFGKIYGFCFDDLVKVASLPTSSLFLIDQSKIIIIELLEKLIPTDLFEGAFTAVSREVYPKNADVIVRFRALDVSRFAAAFFRPSPDLLMILCCLR